MPLNIPRAQKGAILIRNTPTRCPIAILRMSGGQRRGAPRRHPCNQSAMAGVCCSDLLGHKLLMSLRNNTRSVADNHADRPIWSNKLTARDDGTSDAVATPVSLVFRHAKAVCDRALGPQNAIPTRTSVGMSNNEVIVANIATDVIRLVRECIA